MGKIFVGRSLEEEAPSKTKEIKKEEKVEKPIRSSVTDPPAPRESGKKVEAKPLSRL